ncbi:hypothetical protein BYT27DRAFT_7250282 [Phlegmacium glaucopus]|nr:hypothetical protein BYT27DRAFT_7250282 [Phlegmacium glaucopus]
MFPVNITQRTTCQGANTLPFRSYSRPSAFPQNSAPSSQISTQNQYSLSSRLAGMEFYKNPSPNLQEITHTKATSSTISGNRKSSIISQKITKPKDPRPAPYPAHLTPHPVDYRPHCLARDQLYKWKPACSCEAVDTSGTPVDLSGQDLDRIQAVIGCAWSESTRETYGSGLLAFHVYCDSKGLPEEQRTPTSPVLISSFLASLAGAYSNKTLHNYVHGI